MNHIIFSKQDPGVQSLIKFQYGHYKQYSFEYHLWMAIAYADVDNLKLLGRSFPGHVNAWKKYKYELRWWPQLVDQLERKFEVIK